MSGIVCHLICLTRNILTLRTSNRFHKSFNVPYQKSCMKVNSRLTSNLFHHSLIIAVTIMRSPLLLKWGQILIRARGWCRDTHISDGPYKWGACGFNHFCELCKHYSCAYIRIFLKRNEGIGKIKETVFLCYKNEKFVSIFLRGRNSCKSWSHHLSLEKHKRMMDSI